MKGGSRLRGDDGQMEPGGRGRGRVNREIRNPGRNWVTDRWNQVEEVLSLGNGGRAE